MIMASHFPACIKKLPKLKIVYFLKLSEVSKKQNEHCGDKDVKQTHNFKLFTWGYVLKRLNFLKMYIEAR